MGAEKPSWSRLRSAYLIWPVVSSARPLQPGRRHKGSPSTNAGYGAPAPLTKIAHVTFGIAMLVIVARQAGTAPLPLSSGPWSTLPREGQKLSTPRVRGVVHRTALVYLSESRK